MKVPLWFYLTMLFFSIVLLVTGTLIGMGIVLSNDFSYKEVSVITCDYANNLTELVNLQADLLNLYQDENYTNIDTLNCEALLE